MVVEFPRSFGCAGLARLDSRRAGGLVGDGARGKARGHSGSVAAFGVDLGLGPERGLYAGGLAQSGLEHGQPRTWTRRRRRDLDQPVRERDRTDEAGELRRHRLARLRARRPLRKCAHALRGGVRGGRRLCVVRHCPQRAGHQPADASRRPAAAIRPRCQRRSRRQEQLCHLHRHGAARRPDLAGRGRPPRHRHGAWLAHAFAYADSLRRRPRRGVADRHADFAGGPDRLGFRAPD